MCPSGHSLRSHHAAASSSSNSTVVAASDSDLRPAFDVIDVDRDGKISGDDLRSFYAGCCKNDTWNDDVVGSMMAAADTNEDGFVEYEEFERVVVMASGHRSASGGGVMEDAFGVMDMDGDGKLGREDLKRLMAWSGLTVTDEDIEDMIRLGGGDRNDGVSFDGLIQILGLEFVV